MRRRVRATDKLGRGSIKAFSPISHLAMTEPLGQIASAVGNTDVYVVGGSTEFKSLAANDALLFVEQSELYPTVIGLKARHFLKQLPVLTGFDQPYVLEVELDGDYSVVTAAKDLQATLLVALTPRETIDFAILAQLLAKSGFKVIVFYSEVGNLIYEPELVHDLYTGYLGSSLDDAFKALNALSGVRYSEFSTPKHWLSKRSQVWVILGDPEPFAHVKSVAIVAINVYRPFSLARLESILNGYSDYSVVQLLEQSSLNLQFQPLFLDVLDAVPKLAAKGVKVISSQIRSVDQPENTAKLLIANSELAKPIQGLSFGKEWETEQTTGPDSAENAYIKIVKQSAKILNDPKDPSPAYALGKFLSTEKQRSSLSHAVESNLKRFTGGLNDDLANWLLREKGELPPDATADTELVKTLSHSNRTAAEELVQHKEFFDLTDGWIIGSDRWSYDEGLTAFHQALSSGNKHLKLLIIDTDGSINHHQGKKNLGLYALNYGNSYVASVALYSSYTQTLTALLEANAYNAGPAIVIAYLPDLSSHLEILKATKTAVDTGFWPLYRFDPTKEDMFKLDSAFIRRELQDFLDRENKLSLLAAKSAKLQYNLRTYNDAVAKKVDASSKAAYEELVSNLAGEPLLIGFSSDNGNAAGLAKRLSTRAANKGLKVRLAPLDDIVVDDLSLETNFVVITSTSGQGEFPTNGKQFWETVKTSTVDLANVKSAVFGLGDSKYWPRAEDARYYNKPSKDLYHRLELLGSQMLCDLGLGDDQDADGYNTGYNAWEPLLWTALGVSAENADEPPPITNEDMKRESNFLRGTIQQGLDDETTGAISASDQQLTKFHGIYMQDDRDIREQRKQEGMEPAYAFMVRVRLPGNTATAKQWLGIDELADSRGNHTFKITTRATFQLHGIVKKDLVASIREINATAMDTLGACGDVCRNVMCATVPESRKWHEQMAHSCRVISARLLPETTAYHELWLRELGDVPRGEESGPKRIKVGGNAIQDVEPLYTPLYLPRKYKVAITMPPYNDVDVYANDVGLIAIVDDKKDIVGYNLLLGGGMGTTHNNTKTYPRAGTLLGYIEYDDAPLFCEKIMIIQRDNGDRKNRKHARLKYTLDDMGVDVFKAKIEELTGIKFQKSKPFKIESNIDYFGWARDETGLNHYTCYIENGRVADTVETPHKTGMKKIALWMQETGIGVFRLTGNQHVIISDIPDSKVPTIKKFIEEFKLSSENFSGLRKSSQSCVAFPTCGLAMAEAERFLPQFIDKVEIELEKLGLRNDSIVMRMTGCPNGCARPWLAEIALVGKSYGFYNLLLGGSYTGDRVNKLFKTNVDEKQALEILVPLFSRWAKERNDGEHFGDFVIRAGIIKPTLEGRYFWDDLNDDI